MIEKIGVINKIKTTVNDKIDKNEDIKKFVQNVKDGDKKSIGMLVGAGAIAAAAVATGAAAFIKSRPGVIAKSLDKAADKAKEESLALINKTLDGFGVKATEATEAMESKNLNVFEAIQDLINSASENDITGRICNSLEGDKAIKISSYNSETGEMLVELLDGNKSVAKISSFIGEDKKFANGCVFEMENLGKKKNDAIIATFAKGFDGTLEPATEGYEAQIFSDFINRLDVAKGVSDKNFKVAYIYEYNYGSQALEKSEALKNYIENGEITKAKAYLEYSNDEPVILTKNFKETPTSSKMKVYELDENGKWKKGTEPDYLEDFEDEFDDDFFEDFDEDFIEE